VSIQKAIRAKPIKILCLDPSLAHDIQISLQQGEKKQFSDKRAHRISINLINRTSNKHHAKTPKDTVIRGHKITQPLNTLNMG